METNLGDDGIPRVTMAQVGGAYGIKGEIRVHNYNDVPAELTHIDTWYLREPSGRWVSYRVESAKIRANAIIAKLEGISDRDRAAALRGYEVAVKQTALPEPDEDRFYWYELTGMQVINRQQVKLGVVSSLIRSPANDVLNVLGEDGQERLIPMVGAAIDEIDRADHVIRVNWDIDWI